MEKPKVSIQIPTTTGGFNYLAALMPHLAKEAEESDAEIIVVDNYSRDGTVNYLGTHKLTIIVNKANLGFSKAHNQAGRIAQGEYLLLLNNDTMIEPGFINKMLKTFEIDPKIGLVGCCILLMDGQKRLQHAGVMFNEDYVPYELGIGIPGAIPPLPYSDERVHRTREVPSVTFACVMIKKSVWDEIGGLDEEYINGWEDTDFALKAREKGYKIWYCGEATIKHKKHGTPGRFNNETANRTRYDNIWITTGRVKEIIGEEREK